MSQALHQDPPLKYGINQFKGVDQGNNRRNGRLRIPSGHKGKVVATGEDARPGHIYSRDRVSDVLTKLTYALL